MKTSTITHDFRGRRAVVAGGGSGIGRAVVEELLNAGATVVVLDRDVTRTPDGAIALEVDVTDSGAVDAGMAIAAGGALDVLINAVGIEHVATAEETDDEAWNRVLRTNLGSYHATTRAALPFLKEGGAIVNVASQLALVGAPRFTAYTASKAGVLGYTRSLALELSGRAIRVNAVCPGAVDTPLLRRQFVDGDGPQGSMDDLIAMHPMRRLGRPAEIAQPIIFLASDAASFMTGSVLVVDGGYTAI